MDGTGDVVVELVGRTSAHGAVSVDPELFEVPFARRHIGHVVTWQASNRFFALAIDVRQGAELVARVTQEMSVAFTVESGPIEGTLVRLRPGLGKQVIALPSPQPWVMLVAEAR